MATRRVAGSRFDYGAQFFTVRDARFRAEVERWEACGWVKPWYTEGGHTRYRGTEGMAGLMLELVKPFEFRAATRVERVVPAEKGWRIQTDAGEEFSASTLLLTPPAPQTLALLSGCMQRLPETMLSVLRSIAFDPCFALSVTLGGPSLVPPPGCVRLDTGPIALIADNTQKGISVGEAALTIHARSDFTRSCFEMAREEVAQILLRSAEPWLGSPVLTWRLHRWKYSQPTAACAEPCLYASQPAHLAIAGDAFGGPRIEGAFLSGIAAAERIIDGHPSQRR